MKFSESGLNDNLLLKPLIYVEFYDLNFLFSMDFLFAFGIPLKK